MEDDAKEAIVEQAPNCMHKDDYRREVKSDAGKLILIISKIR